jgi:hypothetical protein
MKQSPTQLSLNHLRKQGCDVVQVVETWNSFTRTRKDLFGFIDIIAIKGEETIAVQATSWANISHRAAKIAESPLVGFVRQARWRILIQGWRKNPKTNRYEMKELDVS